MLLFKTQSNESLSLLASYPSFSSMLLGNSLLFSNESEDEVDI